MSARVAAREAFAQDLPRVATSCDGLAVTGEKGRYEIRGCGAHEIYFCDRDVAENLEDILCGRDQSSEGFEAKRRYQRHRRNLATERGGQPGIQPISPLGQRQRLPTQPTPQGR